MEFICTNEECKHTFYPHSYIVFRHPNLARCPKCKTHSIRTEKGKKAMKQYHKDRKEGKFGNRNKKL